jgi:hypothetical protein
MQVAVASESPCLLALRAGRHEACPGADCPLWERGRCTLEQLGADGELYADGWTDEEEGAPLPGQVQFRMSG